MDDRKLAETHFKGIFKSFKKDGVMELGKSFWNYEERYSSTEDIHRGPASY